MTFALIHFNFVKISNTMKKIYSRSFKFCVFTLMFLLFTFPNQTLCKNNAPLSENKDKTKAKEIHDFYSDSLPAPDSLEYTYAANTDEIYLQWLSPDTQDSVALENLLLFVVYKNDSVQTYVPYNNQDTNRVYFCILDSLPPENSLFKVTALYDIGFLGYPGDSAESEPISTDTVQINYGFQLPFNENWDVANFNYNQWTTTGGNTHWDIDKNNSTSSNAAILKHTTSTTEPYIATLQSYYMNLHGKNLGSVFLKFDLELSDYNPDGSESLSIRVSNPSGTQTFEVYYDTATFDFTTHTVNISANALNSCFKVEFIAEKTNSTKISTAKWKIDNIEIYKECAPPFDLWGEPYYSYDGNQLGDIGFHLTWMSPDISGVLPDWLYWGDNDFNSFFGLDEGGTYSVAQSWDSTQLTNWHNVNLYGTKITKIKFVSKFNHFDSICVNIWINDTCIVSQRAENPNIYGWNTVILNNPVTIPENANLKIGYTVYGQEPDYYPVGLNSSDDTVGEYNNQIKTEGGEWESMWNYGFYYNNFSIRALAEDTVSLYQTSTTVGNNYLKGFNIYRKTTEYGSDTNYILYDSVMFNEKNSENFGYLNRYPDVDFGIGYYYKITAIWQSNTEHCESVPARNKYQPTLDYFFIYFENIKTNKQKSEINIYPVPAGKRIIISAEVSIERWKIFNMEGKTLLQSKVNGILETQIDISTLPAGIYFIRFQTDSGTYNRKIIVK